jgi:hypothetical protein
MEAVRRGEQPPQELPEHMTPPSMRAELAPSAPLFVLPGPGTRKISMPHIGALELTKVVTLTFVISTQI